MPRVQKKPAAEAPVAAASALGNGLAGEVFTLSEAAAYLRLSEAEVLRLVREQDLPARQLDTQWRFLKAAIQNWLSAPFAKGKGEGVWAFAGSWKDDPSVGEMLETIYRQRGRPMT